MTQVNQVGIVLPKRPARAPHPNANKERQRNLKRDRAELRADIRIYRDPWQTEAAREQASLRVADTLLNRSGFSANKQASKDYAKLVNALLDTGECELLGVDVAIESAAGRLDIPIDAVKSIPDKIKQRLDKLT